MLVLCNFLKILTVSDKMMHKASRTPLTLYKTRCTTFSVWLFTQTISEMIYRLMTVSHNLVSIMEVLEYCLPIRGLLRQASIGRATLPRWVRHATSVSPSRPWTQRGSATATISSMMTMSSRWKCASFIGKLSLLRKWSLWGHIIPTLHFVRPSFTVYRLRRRNFSWSSHYSKSLSLYWMVFPAGGATKIGSFEHVD